MNKFLLALLFLFFIPTASAKVLTLNEITEASCRVHAGGAYGTGSCISSDEKYYYVLTNSHVVGGSKTVQVEFFKNGRKTLPLTGNVVWSKHSERYAIDFAIIAIDKKVFGKYPPRIIPLAPKDVKIDNKYVASAGCPEARWIVSWEGFVLTNSLEKIDFSPYPLPGQSGSGLYCIVKDGNEYSTRLCGVITWTTFTGNSGRDANGFDKAHGIAIHVSNLYNSLNNASYTGFQEQVQDHWKPIAYTPTNKYALDAEGYYYKIYLNDDGMQVIKVSPKGKLVQWGLDCPTCPNNEGPVLPLPQPRPEAPSPGLPGPNDSNPYGTVPVLPGDEPTPAQPDYQGQIVDLQKQIVQLKADIDSLSSELAKALQANSDLVIQNAQVKEAFDKQLEQKNLELSTLQQKILSLEGKLSTSTENTNTLQIANNKLSLDCTNLSLDLKVLKEQLALIEAQPKGVSLDTTTANTGILAILGSLGVLILGTSGWKKAKEYLLRRLAENYEMKQLETSPVPQDTPAPAPQVIIPPVPQGTPVPQSQPDLSDALDAIKNAINGVVDDLKKKKKKR